MTPWSRHHDGSSGRRWYQLVRAVHQAWGVNQILWSISQTHSAIVWPHFEGSSSYSRMATAACNSLCRALQGSQAIPYHAYRVQYCSARKGVKAFEELAPLLRCGLRAELLQYAMSLPPQSETLKHCAGPKRRHLGDDDLKKGPADLKQPPWDQKGLDAKKQAPPEVSTH